jgi:hypothetical protein
MRNCTVTALAKHGAVKPVAMTATRRRHGQEEFIPMFYIFVLFYCPKENYETTNRAVFIYFVLATD